MFLFLNIIDFKEYSKGGEFEKTKVHLYMCALLKTLINKNCLLVMNFITMCSKGYC